MIKKVILVFKTHFDIGFTDLAENVMKAYAGPMLKEVIATCNSTAHMGKQKYVWTMPAWPLKFITEHCGEEWRGELERLILKGQIVWHALPFTSHTDCCSAEEYIEGLRYSRELSERYGKPCPISAKMTDVPGHGLMLPEILSDAGVKFLHLGCNAFATPPDVPFLFWWQAKSGRRVLTMYSKGGYGTSLLPPKNWEYPVWMALMHTHDNCGPQSASAIEEMVQRIREDYPNAEVVCGTMDDFYRDLEKNDLSKLPVVASDLADTWIHGIGAYPQEVALLRERREEVRRLQAVYAKKLLAGSRKEEGLLDSYYEEVCLFEEHTWGADVKTWLGAERVYAKKRFLEAKKQENYRFMEKSWEEQKIHAAHAAACADELKQRIDEGSGKDWFLFNPNGRSFTGWTILPGDEREEKQPTASGCGLPVLHIGGRTACYASDVPPFSTVKLTIAETAAEGRCLSQRENGSLLELENHRYVLEFDKAAGSITKVYDKKLQKVLLKANDSESVFSYRYHRYGIEKITEYLRKFGYRFSDWGIKDYGRENYPECEEKEYAPEFVSYEVTEHALHLVYRTGESMQKYGDAKEIEIIITLPPYGEEFFAEIRLKEKQETPFVESGSFLLPFLPDAAEYLINKSGTVLNPRTDIQRNANHVLYALENELSVSDGRTGVCVLPLDTPLASFGSTGIYEFEHEFAEPGRNTVYFNLFNNMWGTNFPQWQHGDIACRYVLFGYEKEEERFLAERAAFLKEGLEVIREPLLPGGEELPEHMQLIGARKEEDGVTLRFLERLGEEKERTMVLPGCLITSVDLLGRRLSAPVKEKLVFTAKPNAVCSFFVQRKM